MITPKDKKIILENFTSLSTLQGITYILPIIVLPYLIRTIGPEKFGLIAFAQSFVQYFMILTDYGFSISATRKISLCKRQKHACEIFSSVMTAKMILALASFIILMLAVKFIPKFGDEWMVYVLSFGAVIGNTLFPVWFFQGTEKMKYICVINIIGGIIYALCVFIFVRGPGDYLYVPILNSLFFLITGISGLYIAFRKFRLEFVLQTYTGIKEELRAGWDIFTSVVAINTYTATRIFAVGLLTNNMITGYYSIAERIANVIQTFPLTSLSQAIFPRLSKIFTQNKKRAAKIMLRVQKSTVLAYLLIIPLFFALSPWIVRLVCGCDYAEAVLSLRLLLVSVFFVCSNAFRVQFLLVCGKPDLYAKIHITAALIGLPLIFILILRWSYLGAAASTIATEGGILIATYYLVKKLV